MPDSLVAGPATGTYYTLTPTMARNISRPAVKRARAHRHSGGAKQAAEKLESPVILRNSGDEESRIAMKMLRARSFAALRMTALERFSAASKSPPFQIRGEKSRLNACSTLSGCGTLECGKPDHSRTQDEKHGE
jgi:hypothetical protein